MGRKYFSVVSVIIINGVAFLLIRLVGLILVWEFLIILYVLLPILLFITSQFLIRFLTFNDKEVVIKYPMSLILKPLKIDYNNLSIIVVDNTRGLAEIIIVVNNRRQNFLIRLIHSFEYYSLRKLTKTLAFANKKGAKIKLILNPFCEEKIKKLLVNEGVNLN